MPILTGTSYIHTRWAYTDKTYWTLMIFWAATKAGWEMSPQHLWLFYRKATTNDFVLRCPFCHRDSVSTLTVHRGSVQHYLLHCTYPTIKKARYAANVAVIHSLHHWFDMWYEHSDVHYTQLMQGLQDCNRKKDERPYYNTDHKQILNKKIY